MKKETSIHSADDPTLNCDLPQDLILKIVIWLLSKMIENTHIIYIFTKIQTEKIASIPFTATIVFGFKQVRFFLLKSKVFGLSKILCSKFKNEFFFKFF